MHGELVDGEGETGNEERYSEISFELQQRPPHRDRIYEGNFTTAMGYISAFVATMMA